MECSMTKTSCYKFLFWYLCAQAWLDHPLESLPCHAPVICAEHGVDVARSPCLQHLVHQDHSVVHGQLPYTQPPTLRQQNLGWS